MLFLALFANFVILFIPANAPKGSLYDENETSFSASSGYEYRNDRDSKFVGGGEVYTKFGSKYFRPKAGVYSTSVGSVFLSGGFSKDLIIHENFAFSTHFMPSFSYIRGKDKKDHSGLINFNIGMTAFYSITQNLAIGLEFKHISNGHTSLSNAGLETVGLAIRFRI